MKIDFCYKRGETFIVFSGGLGYHHEPGTKVYDEIKAYLLAHPEALIPEPLPPEPTAEETAAAIRSQRDALMREHVDCYNAARWEEMSEAQREAVRAYRQALLDITEQITFPWSVSWPVLPQ